MGRLKSGEKLLSERELTKNFNVSRGVIREATRALELKEFVIIRQGINGGAFATDLSFDHVSTAYYDLFLTNRLPIIELTYVRKNIEPEVARLAAINITEEGKDKLIKAREEELQSLETFDKRAESLKNIHYVLANICGNKFFEAISKSITKLIVDIVDTVDPHKELFHSLGEHEPIF